MLHLLRHATNSYKLHAAESARLHVNKFVWLFHEQRTSRQTGSRSTRHSACVPARSHSSSGVGLHTVTRVIGLRQRHCDTGACDAQRPDCSTHRPSTRFGRDDTSNALIGSARRMRRAIIDTSPSEVCGLLHLRISIRVYAGDAQTD